MRVLFIGNSHTYFNDMPHIFKMICKENNIAMEVTMIAHGYKGLDFHKDEPEVRFNILYGDYDYVVLQHLQSGFDEKVLGTSVEAINKFIKMAGSKAVLYMPWTLKGEEDKQKAMSDAYLNLGLKLNIAVAPVGIIWWNFKKKHPEIELYFKDNKHASEAGSTLAAYTIFNTIFNKKASCKTEVCIDMADKAYKVIEELKK